MDEQTLGREQRNGSEKCIRKNGKRKNICSDAAALQRKEYYNRIVRECMSVCVQQLINVAGCTATHISAILSSNRNQMQWMWRRRRRQRLDESVHWMKHCTYFNANCRFFSIIIVVLVMETLSLFHHEYYTTIVFVLCELSLTSNKGSFEIDFKRTHRFVFKTLYNINTILICTRLNSEKEEKRKENKKPSDRYRFVWSLLVICAHFKPIGPDCIRESFVIQRI